MTAAHKLNSDQLGKKGESRFPELCIDAGLVPNASTWDRRGWDFIVDWPHPGGAIAYDSRTAPMSCLVQLKTVWSTSKAIKLRLSSAEFIAKDSRPTFIYVLRVADDLSFVDARIAHLEGDLLALILKQLRKARVDRAEPNGVEIRVPLDKWFETLPADGQSLRAAIERFVGPSLEAYGGEKQRQLRELGYEKGGKFLTTTLKGDDVEHVVEAFLGLRRIETVATSAVDRRFGMEVPIPELNMKSGAFEISPRPKGGCIVAVERVSDGASFSFKGNVFGVPAALIPADQMSMLIRTELFDLMLRGHVPEVGRPDIKLTIRTDGDRIGGIRAKASKWADFYGFIAALGEEPLHISIKAKKLSQPLVGKVNLKQEEQAHRWRRPARLSGIAADVLSRAGWPGTQLRIGEIGEAAEDLEVLAAMIDAPEELTRLSFHTEIMPGAVDGDAFDMLFFDRFMLGEHCIAYAVEVQLAARFGADGIVWAGGVPKFRDLKRLKCSTADYNRYVDQVRSRTGLKSYFAAHSEEVDPAAGQSGARPPDSEDPGGVPFGGLQSRSVHPDP